MKWLLVPAAFLCWRCLFYGSTPKPWSKPGYGKRRNTQYMKDFRARKEAGR